MLLVFYRLLLTKKRWDSLCLHSLGEEKEGVALVKRTNAHFTFVIVLLEGFIKYLMFALEGF